MRPTPSSRPRSPSSTRSPICARRSAPTCRTSRAASGSTTASAAKFLHAGPGYGGSCFPKDTLALIKTAQDHGAPVRIVETVAAVNEQRKRAMARKVVAACGGSVRGQDDRGARPDLQAEHRRHARGALAGDRGGPSGWRRDRGPMIPRAWSRRGRCWPTSTYCARPYDCAEGRRRAGHRDRMGRVPGARLRARHGACCKAPVLIDLRNIYRPDDMRPARFYLCGRRPAAVARADHDARGRMIRPRGRVLPWCRGEGTLPLPRSGPPPRRAPPAPARARGTAPHRPDRAG